MRKEQIFKELSKYLQIYHQTILGLSLVDETGMQLCMSITTIIKEYNSSDKNEKEVCRLMGLLCKRHFSKLK